MYERCSTILYLISIYWHDARASLGHKWGNKDIDTGNKMMIPLLYVLGGLCSLDFVTMEVRDILVVPLKVRRYYRVHKLYYILFILFIYSSYMQTWLNHNREMGLSPYSLTSWPGLSRCDILCLTQARIAGQITAHNPWSQLPRNLYYFCISSTSAAFSIRVCNLRTQAVPYFYVRV